MAMRWDYVRLNEKGQKVYLPMNDLDGKITGKCVLNVKAWFDEHPDEWKKRGWIKRIHHDPEDQINNLEELLLDHYLVNGVREIDQYTVEDAWRILPKSEEMMVFEDMANALGLTISMGSVERDGNGGIIY